MITVTAKNLRDNLSLYLDRLQSGEEIAIIRHSEIIGSLQPASPLGQPKPNGSAIAAMLECNKRFLPVIAVKLIRQNPARNYTIRS